LSGRFGWALLGLLLANSGIARPALQLPKRRSTGFESWDKKFFPKYKSRSLFLARLLVNNVHKHQNKAEKVKPTF
jgi:hypothetical protein